MADTDFKNKTPAISEDMAAAVANKYGTHVIKGGKTVQIIPDPDAVRTVLGAHENSRHAPEANIL